MIGGAWSRDTPCSPLIGQELRAVFSASWRQFVTSVLLGRGLGGVRGLGPAQSILALHWAPYWYTCNTCHTGDIVRSPDVGTRA